MMSPTRTSDATVQDQDLHRENNRDLEHAADAAAAADAADADADADADGCQEDFLE
jgi:hypothetical protein